MKSFATGLAAAAAVLSLASVGASAADLAARAGTYRQHAYDRPIPRVYYQSVRPTAICRVGFLRDEKGWPKERGVARCTNFR